MPHPQQATLLDAIKDEGLLQDLDPHHVHKLAGFALESSFNTDHIIFREHDPAGYMYVISSGSVVLEIVAPARRISVQTVHRGDVFGWSALLGSSPRHFQARALSPVTAVAFDGAEMRAACEHDPKFGYALMKRLLEVVTERVDSSRRQIGKTSPD